MFSNLISKITENEANRWKLLCLVLVLALLFYSVNNRIISTGMSLIECQNLIARETKDDYDIFGNLKINNTVPNITMPGVFNET